MSDRHSEEKSAVFASATILQEIMTLYDRCGLAVAAAYLSQALDAACSQAGVDRASLTQRSAAEGDGPRRAN